MAMKIQLRKASDLKEALTRTFRLIGWLTYLDLSEALLDETGWNLLSSSEEWDHFPVHQCDFQSGRTASSGYLVFSSLQAQHPKYLEFRLASNDSSMPS